MLYKLLSMRRLKQAWPCIGGAIGLRPDSSRASLGKDHSRSVDLPLELLDLLADLPHHAALGLVEEGGARRELFRSAFMTRLLLGFYSKRHHVTNL